MGLEILQLTGLFWQRCLTIASSGDLLPERIESVRAGYVCHVMTVSAIAGPFYYVPTLVSKRLKNEKNKKSAGEDLLRCYDNVFDHRHIGYNSITAGAAVSIPGIIQVEDYDSYYDTTSGNSGKKYRTDNVDIERCSEGGYDVSNIVSGDGSNIMSACRQPVLIKSLFGLQDTLREEGQFILK